MGAVQGYEGETGRELAGLYEQLHPAELHADLVELLSPDGGAVLDVGAGSGRDAAWLASSGHTVVAVEPSATMRAEAARRHADPGITWLDDSLPALPSVLRLGISFDLILLSAVWMHVAPADRARAFRKLVTLLKPGGILAFSLRHGPPDAARGMHDVSVAEIETLAKAHGLALIKETRSADRMNRPGLDWTSLVLRLPDDGTGALPLLRHVILNDAKSASYKLGLLRAVARAADSSQGMARPVGDDSVALPLGLIALNWLRLYKPLVENDLPQTPKNIGAAGLGFAKDGWRGIASLPATDLRVGAQFADATAAALHAALRDAAATIAAMPAHYMTLPGSDRPILPTTKARAGPAPRRLSLEAAYLWRFGELRVPLHLWRALARYSVWIEPALVAEWTRLMEGFARGQNRVLNPAALALAMKWHEPERDVRFARSIALEMAAHRRLYCVWTGRRLSEGTVDIDHCLPWSAWPCEDLWNLMPSDRQVNQNSKRERLPSAAALEKSMDRITDWWEQAYEATGGPTAERFRIEAAASLTLADCSSDSAMIFHGLRLRRLAIRADQRLAEWSPAGMEGRG